MALFRLDASRTIGKLHLIRRHVETTRYIGIERLVLHGPTLDKYRLDAFCSHLVSALSCELGSSQKMAFISNSTSSETLSWANLGPDGLHPLTAVMTTFMTAFLSLAAYMSYTPKCDGKAPAFTSDSTPFLGSWNFFFKKM